MSRLTDLLRQVRGADAQLGADLEKEITALTKRRSFGLVFERHQPEAVELPHQPIRRGAKVRVLPPRGETKKGDQRLWRVESLEVDGSGKRTAQLLELTRNNPERIDSVVDDLVVVAEFEDTIYPGLVETGRVERGGDKPHHIVINAENFHALEMLTYTHRGMVDAIYIDPPYNTGARDWKYNNDYVEGDDDYRHSKWLAFMERRLRVARELLNPRSSVLIATIDEKEYLRLGMLLEQVFPEAQMQMISGRINPSGVARGGEFRRSDEYIFILRFGDQNVIPAVLGPHWEGERQKSSSAEDLDWNKLRRTGTNTARTDRPNLFYPFYVDPSRKRIVRVGEPIPLDVDRNSVPCEDGLVAVWPIGADGSEGNWQIGPAALRTAVENGYVKLGGRNARGYAVYYLKAGEQKKIETGYFEVVGKRDDGSVIVKRGENVDRGTVPTTQWAVASHDAATHGTRLIRSLLPGRKFPFPKALYAVEDALRFFIADKPNAVVLDFFSGSGTTAHAVMRLNRQYGGQRQSISITNNEVGADEQQKLLRSGLRAGDTAWEQLGICDFITKPRIRAAITGNTPDGEVISGSYRYVDEFPLAEGFQENAIFYTLTYETPLSVRHNRSFGKIAPLLWMKSGSRGRVIHEIPERGWDVAENYGVISDLDEADAFISAMRNQGDIKCAFVISDDDAAFQMIARELPADLRVTRLYETYLQNFELNQGRNY